VNTNGGTVYQDEDKNKPKKSKIILYKRYLFPYGAETCT
jgi:hypothetical protein